MADSTTGLCNAQLETKAGGLGLYYKGEESQWVQTLDLYLITTQMMVIGQNTVKILKNDY